MRGIGSATRARHSLRFFRTAPGEYGAGDRFLGLTVPQVRELCRQHADLPLPRFYWDADTDMACVREAVATIRIKSTEGQVLFTHDYPTRDVSLAFNPNSDQTGLREEIESWTQNVSDTGSAAELPAWPAGADHQAAAAAMVHPDESRRARPREELGELYEELVETHERLLDEIWAEPEAEPEPAAW